MPPSATCTTFPPSQQHMASVPPLASSSPLSMGLTVLAASATLPLLFVHCHCCCTGCLVFAVHVCLFPMQLFPRRCAAMTSAHRLSPSTGHRPGKLEVQAGRRLRRHRGLRPLLLPLPQQRAPARTQHCHLVPAGLGTPAWGEHPGCLVTSGQHARLASRSRCMDLRHIRVAGSRAAAISQLDYFPSFCWAPTPLQITFNNLKAKFK